ncbi:MAG: hypothetical protein KGL39_13275 [Patescibacteria group bacterium]|nr:hypothetical protein [Patescibacteria group bacterium]
MTKREVKLAKAILDVLHNQDGGQLSDIQIHAEAQLELGERIPLAEFSGALALCDARRWVTGVKSKFSGIKYNISDGGESARLELN